MCIAIYKPAGTAIPFEHLKEGQRSNPDGCGMAWVEDGRIQTFKSMSFKEWTENYEAVLDRCGEINMLIHFRITSRGKTCLDLCHPFMVDEHTALIHNGTITSIKTTEHGPDSSDTKYLAEEILSSMPERWYENMAIGRLLEDFIGWSKIAVLNDDDEVYIFNETKDQWDNGIWYSNKGYKSYATTTTTRTYNWQRPDNKVVDMSEWSYQTPTKNLPATTRYEQCDECMISFPYGELAWYKGQLFCDSCLDAEKKHEAILAGLDSIKTNPLTEDDKVGVKKPCGCCRAMTSEESLWEVTVYFHDCVFENTHQLDFFQVDLLRFDDDCFETFGVDMDLCEACFDWIAAIDISGIKDYEVLDVPASYDIFRDPKNIAALTAH